jgi:hypothetical protein
MEIRENEEAAEGEVEREGDGNLHAEHGCAVSDPTQWVNAPTWRADR